MKAYSPRFVARPVRLAVQTALLCLAFGSAPTFAQTNAPVRTAATQQQFDIPAGSLAEVLSRYAGAAGITLAFDAGQLSGMRSEGLQGRYTVDQGFSKLLYGTGFDVVPSGDTRFTLRRLPQSGSAMLPEVQVVGATDRDSSTYGSRVSNSLGFKLPIQKAPATINTVTEEFWDATTSRTLDEVMSFVPGVNLTDNGGWTGDTLIIRGFAATLPYRDGMRSVDSGYQQSLRAMPDTIERIEVVKGPAGAEFGVAEPGGAVNFVTKKPTRETLRSLNLGIGQDGYRKIGSDFSGGLNQSGDVQGRLVFAYVQPEEWRAGRPDNTQRYVFAPSVNLDYGNNSNLLLAYERNYQKSPQDRGIIYLEGAWKGGFAPRDWSYHQTSSNQTNQTDRLTLSNKHNFTDNLTLNTILERQKYKYRLSEFRNALSEPGWGPLYNADGHSWSGARVIDLLWDQWAGDTNANSFKIMLDYSFGIGGGKHTLSGGFDRYRAETTGSNNYYDVTNTFDIFNPVNNQTPNITAETGIWKDKRVITEKGQSFKWLGEWTERFRTILGVRRFDYTHDYSANYTDFIDPSASYPWNDAYDSKKTSYRLAASYDLLPQHTAFVGFSDGYVPQSGIQRSGAAVQPIHDKAIEAGLKSRVLDNRVFWTNSVYQTKRQDMPLQDPNNAPTESFVINGGSAKIRGLESELMGQVTNNLRVRAGLSLMRSEITANDNADFIGNRFANTPEKQYSLLASYAWGAFGLSQLSTDVGAIYMGNRYGNSGNTITLPSYTVVNLGATYRFDAATSLRLSIVNAFDETYYTGMQDSGARADQVMVGMKRNAFLTLTHNF